MPRGVDSRFAQRRRPGAYSTFDAYQLLAGSMQPAAERRLSDAPAVVQKPEEK